MYGSDEEPTDSNYDQESQAEETEPSPPLDEQLYDDDEEEEQNVEEKVSSPVVRKEPWDQRGKNGLYGGGGRGADNTETGWVSEYESEAPEMQQRSASKEDARSSFDNQEENYRQTTAAVPKPFLPSHRYNYQTHHKRPSSSGTDYSSYGPITPIDTNFPASSHIQPVLGYQTLYNAPAVVELQPALKDQDDGKLASAIVFPAPPHLRQHREMSVPNIGSPLIGSPESDAAHQRRPSEPTTPLTDSPRPAPSPLRKKPIHHGPLVGAKPLQTTAHDVEVKSKKSSGTFRWSGRSKKAPTISNPILPNGFIESLGMSTFELTPGGSPAQARPVSTPVVARKEAKKVVNKPSMEKILQTAPLRPLRSVSSLEKIKVKPADVSAPRTYIENSPRDFRQEMSEAFKRLSDNSDVSHYAASSLASVENSRQLYFNGLRDRSSATVEVQANRREVPFSAHDKPRAVASKTDSAPRPTAPLLPAADVHPSSPDSQPTPKPSLFRDPWLNKSRLSSTPPASADPSPRSAAPVKKIIPVVRSSYGLSSTASPSTDLRTDNEQYRKKRNDSEATLTIKLGSRALESRGGSVTPPTPTNLNTRRPSHGYRQSMSISNGVVIGGPQAPVHHISLVPEETSPNPKPYSAAGWEPGW